MSSCPGERALRFLGTDALGDATYAAIEQHVEGCPECKEVLERLAHWLPDSRSSCLAPSDCRASRASRSSPCWAEVR